ncbi:hypothetical protein ISN45_Aa03g030810 [Arabidopsis thaliana x Arabidopsis arenosa]|uniref:Transmembrane protein n=1 Tax=Arabidopsis thaliana x Arabidopsis arenosa TaxID=1240361 RepID=A0A8T2AYS9_9BRAS|nr:hypothetical protein ISN45_Aa03g030440 [Arabidopsis thaliana x Arabidopsis arenosa]KAG7578916.1 hypothetical protein ISN45_Aa03g030810 [Arabidopsis thaliana x Arabidopsis arenosa]
MDCSIKVSRFSYSFAYDSSSGLRSNCFKKRQKGLIIHYYSWILCHILLLCVLDAAHLDLLSSSACVSAVTCLMVLFLVAFPFSFKSFSYFTFGLEWFCL